MFEQLREKLRGDKELSNPYSQELLSSIDFDTKSDKVKNVFGKTEKITIWMIHLWRFPWQNWFDTQQAFERKAIQELHTLYNSWFDWVIVENREEDSNNISISTDRKNDFFNLLKKLKEENLDIALWLNVLHNDYASLFHLLEKVDFDFWQLDVLADRVETEFIHSQIDDFIIDVDAKDFMQHRTESDKLLFAWIDPKHYKNLSKLPLQGSWLINYSHGSDVNVITWVVTWEETDVSDLRKSKKYLPNWITSVWSWVNKENINLMFENANAVIVWSSIKETDRMKKPKSQVLWFKAEELIRAIK